MISLHAIREYRSEVVSRNIAHAYSQTMNNLLGYLNQNIVGNLA